MKHETIVYNWVNQVKPHGKSGNIFYENDVIYSYGKYFPIARLLDSKTALLSYASYITTTERHKKLVANGCSQMEKIYCAYPMGTHEDNVNRYILDGLYKLNWIANVLKPKKYITSSKFFYDNMQKYISYYRLELTKEQKERVKNWEVNLQNCIIKYCKKNNDEQKTNH